MPIIVAPIKCNNFKWVKLKTWTLYQTACILSGIEPNPESKVLYEDTSNILDLLAAAIEAETLLPMGNYHGDVKFYPLEIIAWAKTIGMDISEEFTVIALIHSETRPVVYPRNPDTKKAKDRALRVIKGLKNDLRLIRLPHGANSLRQQPIGIPANTVSITQIPQQQVQVQPISQHGEAIPRTDSEDHWRILPNDPPAEQQWYAPARHYARKLVADDPTLNKKRPLLSEKVAEILFEKKIFKRGGKLPIAASTILKAFSSVNLT